MMSPDLLRAILAGLSLVTPSCGHGEAVEVNAVGVEDGDPGIAGVGNVHPFVRPVSVSPRGLLSWPGASPWLEKAQRNLPSPSKTATRSCRCRRRRALPPPKESAMGALRPPSIFLRSFPSASKANTTLAFRVGHEDLALGQRQGRRLLETGVQDLAFKFQFS